MAKKADNCQNNFLSNSKYMVRKNNAISILLTNETGQWNLSPLTPPHSIAKALVRGSGFLMRRGQTLHLAQSVLWGRLGCKNGTNLVFQKKKKKKSPRTWRGNLQFRPNLMIVVNYLI